MHLQLYVVVFLLIWVGKKIDDVNIFKFAFFVTILLSFACFFFSRITSVFLLFIAIFLMRFSGQGMMSHTASTTISRYFTRTRGRALSISWFGLSSAEFIMPVLMVYLLTIYRLAKSLAYFFYYSFNYFTNCIFFIN